MSSLSDAVAARRSHPRVTSLAPTRDELLPLVAAAATTADHAALRPWRFIELRGDARVRLGAALVEASGSAEGIGAEANAAETSAADEKLAAKPLRASLLIAVVVCVQPNVKVPQWEQEAAASGVAHMLSLLLSDAGWGVMWRSGPVTRSIEVRRMHALADNERLLGWLYVGGVPADARLAPRAPIDPQQFLQAI